MPVDPSSLQLTTTINLKVRQTGVQRVTYEMLRDAGLNLSGVPVARITVINHGMMMPVYVYMPDQAESFGAGGYIEYYGEALDTIYTDTNIYTVQVSSAPVSRIPGISPTAAGLGSPASYTHTLIVNNQRTYASTTPGKDPWYEMSMLVNTTSKTWDFKFDVNGLADRSLPAALN